MSESNKINYSLAEYSLKEWGIFYARENVVPDIGYPKMSAFMKEYMGGGGYVESFQSHFDDVSETCSIVHRALLSEPLLYQVAQTSFVHCRNETLARKAVWLRVNKGIYLGSTDKSTQIKYRSLEDQLLAYIQGYIVCIDED